MERARPPPPPAETPLTGARITRARTSSTPTHHRVVLAGATPIHPRTVITLVIDRINRCAPFDEDESEFHP
tara:strand:- start:3186 stop:3398 length:213 start_codon:yes stop_codon:yes gene_type:complete